MLHKGVRLESRKDRPDEIDTAREIVDCLEPRVRRGVSLIWCDSKAGSDWTIELHDGADVVHAREVAAAVRAVLRIRCGGWNGFRVLRSEWLRDPLVEADPEWFEDVLEEYYAQQNQAPGQADGDGGAR